ncbi:MAG: hypothetical protein RI911_275, partial [Candidatus Parcubacteria bacterium]
TAYGDTLFQYLKQGRPQRSDVSYAVESEVAVMLDSGQEISLFELAHVLRALQLQERDSNSVYHTLLQIQTEQPSRIASAVRSILAPMITGTPSQATSETMTTFTVESVMFSNLSQEDFDAVMEMYWSLKNDIFRKIVDMIAAGHPAVDAWVNPQQRSDSKTTQS